MPLPSPNLDDRTHRDIVEEVVRLIPQYCPEWTNHNPSDPGITLVELFAWMTELVIYRLNKVTDKTYLKLLDLLGVKLLPPQPALAHLSFTLADGAASPQLVAAHTQVATEQTEESDAVIFETEADLWVHDVALEACFSVAGDRVSDNTARLLRCEPAEEAAGRNGAGAPPAGPVDVFMGVNEVERFLYLGDARFGALTEASKVHVKFDCPHARRQEFTSLLEWDYWNGRRWRPASARPHHAEDGSEDPNRVVFSGPLEEMAPVEVDGKEDWWLRARLIEVPPDDSRTLVGGVTASVEVLEEGVAPGACLANFGSSIFVPVDLSKSFLPFGEEPKFDNTFYIASPGCFSRADTRIALEVALTASSSVERPRPSADLRLVWEFYDGKRWQELGTSTPEGPVAAGHDFDDGTAALSRDGTVSFLRPASWQAAEVNGEESWWLRARIFEGDYGQPGRYVQQKETWVWKDDRPLAPPSIREVRIKYNQVPFALERVLSYNDYTYRTHAGGAAHRQTRRAAFQPFEPQKEENPAIYLGFARNFPKKDIRVYLRFQEEVREEREGPEFHLDGEPASEGAEGRADQRVVWEYWNGKAWASLHPDDQTRHFTESGYLGFAGPRDHAAKREFGIEHYWLRARLEMGSYSRPPKLEAVLLNTVPAINAVTIRNEVLGSSDGSPDQAVQFAYAPVLEGPEIHLREPEPPAGKDREALEAEEGEEAIQVTRDEAGEVQEVWVRWHPVDSFYGSGPRSRHYVFEAATRQVRFGDGRRGMVPPSGQDNVRATRYQCGGGREGNVGAGSLTVLKRSLAYIGGVVNHFAAGGGSDLESIDDAKLRGPQIIRNRYRAVTAEDFEWLAMKASSNVARVRALPNPRQEGEVRVLVIPQDDPSTADPARRLVPTPELVRRVRGFLDRRRLITCRLSVEKPRYVEVTVHLDIQVKAVGPTSEWVRRELVRRVRRFLHPLTGGPDGHGWPFGRDLHKSDLYNVVESVDAVERVEDIQIHDEDRRRVSDRVELRPDELLHVVDVIVNEVARVAVL